MAEPRGAGAAAALLSGLLLGAAPADCPMKLAIDHTDAPLQELRRLGAHRDDFQESVPAVPIDPGIHRPLTATRGLTVSGQPALWLHPGTKEAVADARCFGSLKVVDATRLGAGAKAALGHVTPAAVRELGFGRLAELLIRGAVIRTYAHVGASLCLTVDEPARAVMVDGEHEYFTNERNVGRIAFTLRVAADGAMVVEGR